MSDFARAFDEQSARKRAEEERRSQLLAQGRANIKAFMDLMAESGIPPARLPPRLVAEAGVADLLSSVARGDDIRTETPDHGWVARFWEDNPRYRVSHYLMEDGRVLHVWSGGGERDPCFVSEDALANGEALAAQAMDIITSGDAHHGDKGGHRPR